MSDEKPPEIDWDELRKAALNLAECVWTYHQALVSSGFTEEQALPLTMAYQGQFLSR